MTDTATATAPRRRGRPPGSGKKPADNPPSNLAQVAGANGSEPKSALSNEQNGALLFLHKKRIQDTRAAVQAARTAVKNAEKAAKSDLGKYGVDMIDIALDLETADGRSKYEAQHARTIQVALMLNLPLGAQGDMFKADRRPREEIAYGEGFQDGASGEDQDPSKWGAETKPGQKYLEGYAAGQSSIFKISELRGAPLFRQPEADDAANGKAAEADSANAGTEGAADGGDGPQGQDGDESSNMGQTE